MKIEVDFDLCEANAICVAECPEVFWVDDQDYLQVREEAVSEELRGKLERAARACPRRAIKLID